MAQGVLLKDTLFNAQTVGGLAARFEKAGVFEATPFADEVLAGFPALELKARINLIAQVLQRYLPAAFPEAVDAILASLPAPLDPTLKDNDFGHFIYAPLGVFVENNGLEDHLDRSLTLLEELTQRFSMEFSIRAFLNRWPEQTIARMQDWVTHESYHVRRLVSEGTRPRLPWGQNIGLTSAQTLPLLDRLHADDARFVTRSVANHLNDISKKDPDAVVARFVKWDQSGAQSAEELDWMRRHAMRGLIKSGHPAALTHLGYFPDVAVDVACFSISPNEIARGGSAVLDISLTTRDDASLIVDYVVDFVKANGKTSPKVFKLKVLQAKAKKPVQLSKTHKFIDTATTFRLFPGVHQVSLQINGCVVATRSFTLT